MRPWQQPDPPLPKVDSCSIHFFFLFFFYVEFPWFFLVNPGMLWIFCGLELIICIAQSGPSCSLLLERSSAFPPRSLRREVVFWSCPRPCRGGLAPPPSSPLSREPQHRVPEGLCVPLGWWAGAGPGGRLGWTGQLSVWPWILRLLTSESWGEVKCYFLSCVRLFGTPWTGACQALLSMGFSRQEYWSGLQFPSPGDLPNTGIEPWSPALQAASWPSEPPERLG